MLATFMLLSFIRLYSLEKLDYGLHRNHMLLNYFAKYRRLKGKIHKNYLMRTGHRKIRICSVYGYLRLSNNSKSSIFRIEILK